MTVAATPGLAPIDRRTARRIAADLVADLESGADALRTRESRGREARRDRRLAGPALGPHRQGKGSSIDGSDSTRRRRVALRLEPGKGQGPPLVVATLHGTSQTARYAAGDGAFMFRSTPRDVVRTFELVQSGSRYLVTGVRGAAAGRPTMAASPRRSP